jgi:hypothetical protein
MAQLHFYPQTNHNLLLFLSVSFVFIQLIGKKGEKGVLAPNSADYGKQARSIVSAYLSHRLPGSFVFLLWSSLLMKELSPTLLHQLLEQTG